MKYPTVSIRFFAIFLLLSGTFSPVSAQHEHDEHRGPVVLSPKEMQQLQITLGKAGPGRLDIRINQPGEVRLNEDRVAHVVPNVSGVVREVVAHLGDEVAAGDVMVVLDSRELAESKSAHLAAHAQFDLSEVTFNREQKLWEDKISAEQDFLRTRLDLEKARIELRTTEQRLYALGLSKEGIHAVESESGVELTRFNVAAPFAGTVIEKHVTLGEAVEATDDIFVVADLSTVWVDLNVYSKDLLSVREGQHVVISTDTAIPEAVGTISYIGPVVGEETRTAMARVVLPNPDGFWRPGLFVTAGVAVDDLDVPIKVPRTALHTIEGKAHVFVRRDEGFEATEVTVGVMDHEGAEILAGLNAGDTYVATGGFYLKAEMEKESFAGEGHSH